MTIPCFSQKLDRFLAAFAARYDGKTWLRYVDIGSFGDWGEGHTFSGSQRKYGFDALERHVDLHLKHFRRTPLVISDDFVYSLAHPDDRGRLHAKLLQHRVSYRDDSILVDWYVKTYSPTFTVRSRVLCRRVVEDTDGPRTGALRHRQEQRQLDAAARFVAGEIRRWSHGCRLFPRRARTTPRHLHRLSRLRQGVARRESRAHGGTVEPLRLLVLPTQDRTPRRIRRRSVEHRDGVVAESRRRARLSLL